MITTSRKERATVKDVRLTMKKFVDSLRKKDIRLLQRVDTVIRKRDMLLDRARTDTDDSVSSATKSMSSPQSTPTSSPPLSPRIFLVPSAPMRSIEAQFKVSPLLELEDDDSTIYNDSERTDEWGQFTCIE